MGQPLKAWHIDKDGPRLIDAPPDMAARHKEEMKGKLSLVPESEDAYVSPARKRWQRLADKRITIERVKAVEFDGEEYYIRRLRRPEYSLVNMLYDRIMTGELSPDDEEFNPSLFSAMLFIGVAGDEYDSENYFETLEEARELVDSLDPYDQKLQEFLIPQIWHRNPDIIMGQAPPGGGEPMTAEQLREAKEWLEKKDNSAVSDGVMSEPSMTPEPIHGENGGKTTDSTGEPFVLPISTGE